MTTEERTGTQEASQANGLSSNATDTNRGNKGAKESENQDNAVEDDCIIGLDVADVWEDEEKDKPRRRSWDRSRGREKRVSREREKERDRDHNRGRRRSRSRGGRRSRSRGGGRRSRSNERRRSSRSNERKREPSRRDPSKSNNAIEQDKLRAKKDNDSKILAEKEKAIKTLLDSDNVLPPGTETEAIQTIVEKNQQEQEIRNQEDRNRDRSNTATSTTVRNRLGPKKLSKSPGRGSPPRRGGDRRSPLSPGSRRRRSVERDASLDRRIASRRRLRERERELRFARRSRSRGSRDRRRTRSRSRSFERRRISRSPDRGRRNSSRSPFERRLRGGRSRSRSQERARRRSPFINELARQFSSGHEGILPSDKQQQQSLGIAAPSYSAVPPPLDPRMGGLLPTPGMPGPNMMNPMHPGVPIMHPGGPRGPPFLGYDGGPPGPQQAPFDPLSRGGPGPVVDYPVAPVIFANPIINPVASHPMRPVSPVPQPVPAPVVIGQGYAAAAAGMGAAMQHQAARSASGTRDKYSPIASYGNRHSGSPGDKTFPRGKSKREERMKTPEPPIISDVVVKQNEKTSLSSLLEASVSSKDVSSSTASSKGYRPEILRHCERALRSLPTEDPRLKMKGRFFFDPARKEEKKDKPATGSNSILRRKGRTEIYWDEEHDQMSNGGQPPPLHHQPARRVLTHPKYCQTEPPPSQESVGTQAEETPKTTTDFSQQVGPADLMGPPVEDNRRSLAMIMEESRRVSALDEIRRPIVEENRRPIIDDNRRPIIEDNRRAAAVAVAMEDNRRPVDRLDWSMRETYDHGADRIRDKEDLRWSLSNSAGGGGGIGGGPIGGGGGARPSERLPWSRGFSPKPIDHMHGNAPNVGGQPMPMDNYMRNERNDMDLRDRDMDLRMDMRVLDMLRERERLMGTAGLTTTRSAGMLDEFTTRRQQPVNDDFDMRMNFGGVGGGGGGGGPGSIGSFNRAMEMMERERNEQHGGPSPIPEDPDDDDLEIIEERGPWPPPMTTPAAAVPPQFANARGGNANRSALFRGRLGGYRNY